MGKGNPKRRQNEQPGKFEPARVYRELHVQERDKARISHIVRKHASLHPSNGHLVTCILPPHEVVFPDRKAAADTQWSLKHKKLTPNLPIWECRQGHMHLRGLAGKMKESHERARPR